MSFFLIRLPYIPAIDGRLSENFTPYFLAAGNLSSPYRHTVQDGRGLEMISFGLDTKQDVTQSYRWIEIRGLPQQMVAVPTHG